MTTTNPPSQPAKLHVFVIAHPDDESMFFIPTIKALLQAGETLWILCLTTGDYDGLGKQRTKELQQASKLLGFEKCIVLNKDTIQDHPSQRWKISEVSQAIQKALLIQEKEAISNYQSLVLITFDDMGVSGHVNHVDTYLGVHHLIWSSPQSQSALIMIEAWLLESESNPILKYIPVLSWMYLLLSFILFPQYHTIQTKEDSKRVIYRCHEPTLNWKAMATHQSQFVWYRRLFVVFSCYTYVNTLRKMEPSKVK